MQEQHSDVRRTPTFMGRCGTVYETGSTKKEESNSLVNGKVGLLLKGPNLSLRLRIRTPGAPVEETTHTPAVQADDQRQAKAEQAMTGAGGWGFALLGKKFPNLPTAKGR